MSRSPGRDFAVGLFVLAGLAALAYLSFSVGGLAYGGGDGLKLYADFDQTGGLKVRAPVVISGVEVGQEGAITLGKDYRAHVELQLGGDTKLLKSGDQITFTESAVILERLIGKLVHNADISSGGSKPEPKTD